MIGFDGDPARAAALRAALGRLLEIFPEHLAKPRPRSWVEGEDLVGSEQLDAILRAHKKDRLGIPVQALRAAGGFERAHPRRLAWFVPSLLASWLDRAPGPTAAPFGASDIQQIVDDATSEDEEQDPDWSDDEAAGLAAFFASALDAALATPLGPLQDPPVERPREDGIRVWSLHSPSVPLDVLRVAKALRVPLLPLLGQWALTPSPRALEHLLEAVYDPSLPSKHYLSDEVVADRLGEGFFEATGEQQARLSKAEATVRRNIARRADF